MNKLPLIAKILFFSLGCAAQDLYKIDFSKEKLNLPPQQFYIDSIIDDRVDKSGLGKIYKSQSTKKVNCDFDGEIKKVLGEYFNSGLAKGIDKTPISIRINKLQIDETIISINNRLSEKGKKAYYELDITFLKLDSTRQFAKEQYESFIQIQETGEDLTQIHSKKIAELFNKAFLEFSFSGLTENANAYFLLHPSDSIISSPEKNIVTAKILQKGFYKNYKQFQTNSPQPFTDDWEIRYSPNGKTVKLVNKKDLKKQKSLYGFCDSSEIYLNKNNYQSNSLTEVTALIKVVERGPYFLMEDIITDPNHVVGTVAAGVAFGLIGAAVYAAATMPNTGILLEMNTGMYFPITKRSMEAILSEYEDLLIKYRKIEEKTFDIDRAFIKSYNKRRMDTSK